MSTDGTPASQERQVIVLDGGAFGKMSTRSRGARPMSQTMSTSQRRGVGVAAGCRGSRSPIMSSRMSALSARQRACLLRRAHVVVAAVGVVRIAPLGVDRFFAVEEEQLDRVFVLPRLEHARQLEHRGRGRRAVAGADEPEVREPFRVVVAWRARSARGACPGSCAMTFVILMIAGRRHRIERLFARRDAAGLQLRLDVPAALGQGR